MGAEAKIEEAYSSNQIVSALENLGFSGLVKQLSKELKEKQIKTFLNVGWTKFPSLKEMEKSYYINLLTYTQWNKSEAAHIADIERKTIYNKIKEYQLDK